jgi:hypothetical protein
VPDLGTGLEGSMLRVISMLAVAVVGASMFVDAPPAAAAANPAVEAQFVSLMNADRARAGVGPLAVDPTLTAVARSWSDAIVGAGALIHNPAIESELPAGWTRWGENVGEGSSPDALEAAFMASPEHRANILGAFSIVGVGVDVGVGGTMWVTVDFAMIGPGAATESCKSTNPPSTPSPAAAPGYDVLGSDGGVFTFGSAVFHGSVPGLGVRARTVLMALTPDAGGYWVLGSDGGVFTFGDARYFGSTGAVRLNRPVQSMAATADGHGYWLLAADGGVFTFGDARFLGSPPSTTATFVAISASPRGDGYWLLGST